MKTLFIAASLLSLLPASPASANCYESIGCSNSDIFDRAELENFSCQILWEVRNQIYHENGYCFRTQRALSVFSNDGCMIDDANEVRLNNVERKNIRTIKAVERANAC